MSRLRKIVSRLWRHPTAFSGDMLRRLRPRRSSGSFVYRSDEEGFAELNPHQRVILWAEGTEARDRVQDRTAVVIQWISDRLADQSHGAQPSTELGRGDVGLPDAFVVAGEDLGAKYSSVLRLLDLRDDVRPVHWIGGPFEFAGSTLPVPKEVEDAHFHLFHHFLDFFGVKEPLLVRIRVQTPGREPVEELHLLKPRATLTVRLSDLVPQRDGPTVVEFICTHPVLSRGRHRRWRVWADVFYRGSMSSLHGAHDYGPSTWSESRIPLSEMMPGSLAVTFPNYEKRLSSAERSLRWGAEGSWKSDRRSSDDPVEQRNWSVGRTHRGFAHYCHLGYGDSFWYNFGEGTNAMTGRIMSNHQTTVENFDPPLPVPAEMKARLHAIADQGFLPHPHYLPLSKETDEIQWGFSFDASNPPVRPMIVSFRGPDGGEKGRSRWTAESGVTWTTILSAIAPEGSVAAIVAPDWTDADVDPLRMNYFGHLFVRHRDSGDMDATEFQNCWRNNGVKIEEFPHWIHPSKAVNARSHLIGRVSGDPATSTLLLIAFASGRLALARTATAKVELIRADGRALSTEAVLQSQTHRLLDFRVLFPELDSFFAGQAGTCRISSGEADFNAQIVTRSASGGLSLQHLWGY